MAQLTAQDITPGMKFTVTKDIIGTEYNGCEGYVFLKVGQTATIECFMGLLDDEPEHQFFQGVSDTNDGVIVNVRDIIKVG